MQVNAGDKALFWSDNWNLGNEVSSLQSRFPRLFSFAKDPWISVKAIFNSIDLYQHFHLPLSAQAFDELNLIRNMLVSHTRDDTCKDLWFWQGSSKVYKPKLFYGHVFQNETFNHLLC